jgi:NAD(P)-dependent dehydrogenase (short-subunit alcohol dehydrogenase family)
VKLKGKVALVTGAGSGMGQAIAVLFAREGAKVSVVDIDAARGQQTVALIEQGKGQGKFVNADVSKTADVASMIKTTVAAYGRLDILVNNAGVPMGPTPIDEVAEDLYERIMAVNVKAIYLSAKYATPIMRQQGGGSIINITSIAGVRPRPQCLLCLQGRGHRPDQSLSHRASRGQHQGQLRQSSGRRYPHAGQVPRRGLREGAGEVHLHHPPGPTGHPGRHRPGSALHRLQ